MVCIPKLSIPMIGHEKSAYMFTFSIGIWNLANSENLHIGQPCYLQQRHMNPIQNYQWFVHKHTCLDFELMHFCGDMYSTLSPITTTMLGCIHLYMVKNRAKNYIKIQRNKTWHLKKCGKTTMFNHL
jgi:hypothetical protein